MRAAWLSALYAGRVLQCAAAFNPCWHIVRITDQFIARQVSVICVFHLAPPYSCNWKWNYTVSQKTSHLWLID